MRAGETEDLTLALAAAEWLAATGDVAHLATAAQCRGRLCRRLSDPDCDSEEAGQIKAALARIDARWAEAVENLPLPGHVDPNKRPRRRRKRTAKRPAV